MEPRYGPIYSHGLVEPEMLKTYIKAHLANGFIKPSKSLAGGPILFIQKENGSTRLCIDYQEVNSLTIKNCYPLSLIGELLDYPDCANRFTLLDLINAYYQIRIRENDERKTVFQMRYSYFEYQVIFFGLFNASASLQGYVNKIQVEKLDVFVIV